MGCLHLAEVGGNYDAPPCGRRSHRRAVASDALRHKRFCFDSDVRPGLSKEQAKIWAVHMAVACLL